MRYTVTTVSYRLYYTRQVIYIIYAQAIIYDSFRITYYIRSAYPAMRSYQWYANDTACPMLIDLQKCLNFS